MILKKFLVIKIKLNKFTKKFKENKFIASSYRRLIQFSPLQWAVKDIKNKKFVKDYEKFVSLLNDSQSRFTIRWSDRYPWLNDNTQTTGFDHHYIYHPAWAARIIAKTKPDFHVDISSSLHFCSMTSAFIPVKFFDYRPAKLYLSNLTSDHADITALPFEDSSIQSLSCMHTIEHIGLGRYGDPLDPDGDLKAIAELKRVLSLGGNLLFVVPVGKDAKIMFNAHRIYTYNQIISYFQDLKLVEYSLIPDNPNLHDFIENADPKLTERCFYGCGCFWFRKNVI
jgi:SAM-dependent methyltransferase